MLQEDYDVIVWVPDSFHPPSDEQQQFVQAWLEMDKRHTLVYVGRDFDAAVKYYGEILPLAPPSQAMDVRRKAARQTAQHASRRARTEPKAFGRWFNIDRTTARRQLDTLDGPWAEGVDAKKSELVLNSQLPAAAKGDIPKGSKIKLPEQDKLLLSSNGDPIVRATRDNKDRGQVIVIANGSFVLNLSLVNREHRKLAAKLVEACGPPAEVAFLESGPGEPTVYDEEPSAQRPTGFEVLSEWPIGAIWMHLMILGIIAVAAWLPIFGRPVQDNRLADELQSASQPTPALRGPDPTLGLLPMLGSVIPQSANDLLNPVRRSDFGGHIDAISELMQRTKDEQYARQRLMYYAEHVRRDSRTSHAEKDKPAKPGNVLEGPPSSPTEQVSPNVRQTDRDHWVWRTGRANARRVQPLLAPWASLSFIPVC